MRSSSIIGLFGEPAPVRRGPSAFVISLVLHVFAFGLLFLGLNQPRKADLRSDNQRYSVRIMELHRPEPKPIQFLPKDVTPPGQQAGVRAAAAPGGGPESTAAARIPLNFLARKQVIQTLIQPDVRQDQMVRDAALPQVVQWKPPDPAVIKIVPPPPKPVATIEVHPSLEIPNQETKVADFKMSASPFETKAPMPSPSKTSPVSVQATQQAQRVPETASKDSGHTTPASVISLSEIKVQEGTAVLPLISQVAPTPNSGSLTPGQPKGTSESGNGKTDSKQNGASAGQTAGNQTGAASGAASGASGKNGAAGQGGLGALAGEAGLNTGGGGRSVVQITQPKNGRFGVVVVGTSLAEDYPETVDLWRGRLAYTVYLRVGTAKNWILQYSLPRPKADAAGMVGRPDGPWPYDMTRPSIDADVNTDAIMVHGFVNALGRFDQLAIIFPTELAETKFLLQALQQWQFRPAMQNGVPISVEVLLIIPTVTE